MPTRPRLEYLRDKVSINTINAAYEGFANHMNAYKTSTFLGTFGEKYNTSNQTYKGFFVHNPTTRNMMFFREDSNAEGGYSLHAYMKLRPKKSKDLEKNYEIFD